MSTLDSSDLECPHCGETFFYELTRCPSCGRSVYPDADDESGIETWGVDPSSLAASPSRNATPHPWPGILAGGFLSSILSIFLFFILNNLLADSLESSESPESLRSFIPLASVPLGAFLGSYLAVAINRGRPLPGGVSVGIISIGASILLIAYQYDLTTEPLIRPETILWWIATLLFALLGSYLRHRTTEKDTLQQLFKPRSEYQLYTELLTKVQFDRLTAESLIAYEQKRAPEGTRFEWIQNAIDRWERDNRTIR